MTVTAQHVKGSAIAIGNFDGFHLGHQRIIRQLKTIALDNHLQSIIVTFKPNAKVFFNREKYLINTDEQKRAILEEVDVDRVSVINFADVKDMTDTEFLRNVLIDKYHMKHIVMGENFRFGRRREGDIEFLKQASLRWDFRFTVVKPVLLDGVRISSSLIRKQLVNAEIPLSNRMMGRRYFIEGIVAEGHRMGRELGYPTINLDTPNTILPEGVYKTEVELEGQCFKSITYIGNRPTFDGKEKKVECHIFDFNRNIYGKEVRIYFDWKVRGDMRFKSREELVNQIESDIEKINLRSKINGNIDKSVDKGRIF